MCVHKYVSMSVWIGVCMHLHVVVCVSVCTCVYQSTGNIINKTPIIANIKTEK